MDRLAGRVLEGLVLRQAFPHGEGPGRESTEGGCLTLSTPSADSVGREAACGESAIRGRRAIHHGASHYRRVHQLRRLRARVPERRDLDGRGDLRHRSCALHRVRRPLRDLAMRRGVSGRVHHRRPGTGGEPGRPVDPVPVSDRGNVARLEAPRLLWRLRYAAPVAASYLSSTNPLFRARVRHVRRCLDLTHLPPRLDTTRCGRWVRSRHRLGHPRPKVLARSAGPGHAPSVAGCIEPRRKMGPAPGPAGHNHDSMGYRLFHASLTRP